MTEEARTTTEVITTRSSRRLAEAYIARHADALGDVEHWTGSGFLPATLTWVAAKNAEGRWDVIATHTIHKP